MKALITMLVFCLVLALSAPALAQDSPEALYKAKCQACHGPDGKGTVAGQKMGAKDFHSPEIQKLTEDQMFESVKKGKGKMTPFGAKLTDDQIKSLIKFVRGMK
jgi:mono/diheme cytochrome c family protein